MLRDRLGGTATKGRASPEGSLSSIPLSGFLQHTPSVSEVDNRGGERYPIGPPAGVAVTPADQRRSGDGAPNMR